MASPDEALQPRQGRLGGPAEVAELAPETACAQSRPMKSRHLSMEERIELEASMRAGDTQAVVAARLGRATGTISGELARNGGRTHYRAAAADQASVARRGAARRGRCAIDEHPPLRDEVHAQMRRGWSPEEIAGILKRNYPHLPLMHTSHESIYRYVYVVARGELKRELAACLRRHHRVRKPHCRGVAADHDRIKDMVMIDQRPAEAENRLIAGHYEGDLIMGAGNRSAVGVLVERTTRYTFLCFLPTKDAQGVREAFTRKLLPVPQALRKTLTYDQGTEIREHAKLAADLGLKMFFCHAHSPWERATCESQNDRIRHYLPRGTDLSLVSHQQLSAYQEMLNERPRKILNWKSPAQCFNELLILNQPSS